jgi:hypothetical protein
MAGSPRDVHVDVILLADGNPPDFQIVPKGTGKLPTKNGRLVFENDGRPGFDIYFDLTDGTGQGYKFPPNSKKDDAVWSKVGANSCPETEAWEVFKPLSIEGPDRSVLKVYNENPCPAQGDFEYTLRITTDGGRTYLPLDPGGLNQNGNSQSNSALAVFAIAVGVVVAAGAALYAMGAFDN